MKLHKGSYITTKSDQLEVEYPNLRTSLLKSPTKYKSDSDLLIEYLDFIFKQGLDSAIFLKDGFKGSIKDLSAHGYSIREIDQYYYVISRDTEFLYSNYDHYK